jgi:hypothetical protein
MCHTTNKAISTTKDQAIYGGYTHNDDTDATKYAHPKQPAPATGHETRIGGMGRSLKARGTQRTRFDAPFARRPRSYPKPKLGSYNSAA